MERYADNVTIKRVITRCGCDRIIPLSLVYIFYIMLHGHLTTGGGFQGGILTVAVVLLIYLAHGYEEAKHDFVRRSGLLPKEALFEPEQLAEMHRALAFVCEQDEDLSIGREKEIKTIMEQIKCLLPESPEQTQTMEQSR